MSFKALFVGGFFTFFGLFGGYLADNASNKVKASADSFMKCQKEWEDMNRKDSNDTIKMKKEFKKKFSNCFAHERNRLDRLRMNK